MNSRPVTIIQARMTSSRFPGKVLKKIGNRSAIELMLARLRRSLELSRIVFAIPDTSANNNLANFLAHLDGVDLLRGPEDDVLTRFVQVARRFPAPFYVRLTADCPFICPEIVDEVVKTATANNAWCCTNSKPPSFPDGFDVECLSAAALFWLDSNARSGSQREHVTLGLYQSPPPEAAIYNIMNSRGDFSRIRLTLDRVDDLEAMRILAAYLGDQGVVQVDAASLEQIYSDLGLASINGR